MALVLLGSLIAGADKGSAQNSPTYRAALQSVLANPADPEASFIFAETAVEEGNVREAIAALERVLIINPSLDNIRLELGLLYRQAGSSALAEQFIGTALASPDIPPDVKDRAEAELAAARAANSRWSRTFGLSFGLISDSNANFGPGNPVVVGGSPISGPIRPVNPTPRPISGRLANFGMIGAPGGP